MQPIGIKHTHLAILELSNQIYMTSNSSLKEFHAYASQILLILPAQFNARSYWLLKNAAVLDTHPPTKMEPDLTNLTPRKSYHVYYQNAAKLSSLVDDYKLYI